MYCTRQLFWNILANFHRNRLSMSFLSIFSVRSKISQKGFVFPFNASAENKIFIQCRRDFMNMQWVVNGNRNMIFVCNILFHRRNFARKNSTSLFTYRLSICLASYSTFFIRFCFLFVYMFSFSLRIYLFLNPLSAVRGEIKMHTSSHVIAKRRFPF